MFELKDRFHDFNWILKLSYLADIFNNLNGLNIGLQGSTITIFQVRDKTEGMIKKLKLWIQRLDSGVFDQFPFMTNFIQMSGGNVPKEILGVIKSHLEQLHLQLRKYFPVPDERDLWIRNPFAEVVPTNLSLTPQEEDSLAELSTDSSLKLQFSQLQLTDFWLDVMNGYPELSKKALQCLMVIPTTYLCETAFSHLTYLKSKLRSTWNLRVT